MKIGLGAVQFGLDYGVSNSEGKTPPMEVAKILEMARIHGVDLIDTAASYGDSESVLGECGQAATFRIVTKTPGFGGNLCGPNESAHLVERFHMSLDRLRQPTVYGLLAHRADDLLMPGGQHLQRSMRELKASGLVKKIGVSVYGADQIDRVLETCDIDLIQIPFSLLDQRLLRSGHLEKLKKRNIEIHARSLFLQGLLLMPVDGLPEFFAPIRSHLASCRTRFIEQGIDPLSAALAFVRQVAHIDVAVCGVNHCEQLAGICTAAGRTMELEDYEGYALHDEFFLNPANWKLQ